MYIAGVRKHDKKESGSSGSDKVEYAVPSDMKKAFQFALKGCELGNMYSCANLSQMYKKGDGW
jgi:TPR repeat protein